MNKREVWVWAEHHHGKLAPVSLGLLAKARELCRHLGEAEVGAVVAGSETKPLADDLIAHGAATVYLAVDPSLSLVDTERCARFMAGLVQQHQPEIVLWGATSLGREIASRVAARLGTGLTAHCLDLYIEQIEGKPQLVSVVAGWGGNLAVKIICPQKRPQMATVKPGIFPPCKPENRSGEVIPVAVADKTSCLEVVAVGEECQASDTLEEAATIVVGGWGLSAMGGFTAVRELAQVLGGSVAGTRPAMDAGWVPAESMVGQSGKTVAPELLITLGVSGAPQFASGILGSKFILAVDKNPSAPIFEMADIGIVGDLREVLPLLISKLKTLKEKS